MILAVDAGNSRIKWGLHDGSAWLARGAVPAGDATGLALAWKGIPRPEKAIVSNVAGKKTEDWLRQALAALCGEVSWARALAEQCGVRNGYRNPAQLGSDRWAALIGARGVETGPCLVACAGTALTADALTADGRFRGGIIAPGLGLMERALAGNAAALEPGEGRFAPFPDNTADAMRSGALQALAGAVERMLRQLEAETGSDVRCIVSGGDAPALLPLLPPSTRHVENLVLEGLLRIARP